MVTTDAEKLAAVARILNDCEGFGDIGKGPAWPDGARSWVVIDIAGYVSTDDAEVLREIWERNGDTPKIPKPFTPVTPTG